MKNRTEKTNIKLLYTCRVHIPVRSADPTIARCATAAAYVRFSSLWLTRTSQGTRPLHAHFTHIQPFLSLWNSNGRGVDCVCVKGNVFLTQTASLATNQVFRWSVQYSTQHPRPTFPHPPPHSPPTSHSPPTPPFPINESLWILHALLYLREVKQ